MTKRTMMVLSGITAMLLISSVVSAVLVSNQNSRKTVIVGKTDSTTSTALPGPDVITEAVVETAAEPPAEPGDTPDNSGGGGGGGGTGLKAAAGRAYKPAIPFNSSIPVPSGLQFILVLGSDARPGQDIRSQRADSIHLLAVNPAIRQGTMVGFPRDAYVEIPGHGRSKINDGLARGGPQLMAETVRRLTGLPVNYYVLTGFEGLPRMVDDLGGVDVFVDRRMDDSASGARFETGWQRMTGTDALAYSRNRKDTPAGDFSRSQNQGNVILSALGKMRSEVGDDPGLLRWVEVLRRHVLLDVPVTELPKLGALARRIDPSAITNVVAPGRVGSAGAASVVYLTDAATALFNDLRDDAVINQTTVARAPTPPGAEPSPEPVGDTPPPADTVPPNTTTTRKPLIPGLPLPILG